MNLFFNIPFNNTNYSFSLLHNCCSQRVFVKDFCVIDIYKHHNHLYSFKAFFYFSKHLISMFYCNSKSKLYCALQELLQEELLYVKQFK